MRKLGIEIECLIPCDYAPCDCGDEDCEDREGGEQWDLVARRLAAAGAIADTDASINSRDGFSGMEVRIGHVAGDAAEAKIKQVCAILNEANAIVDNSTGLHVHADCPELAFNGDFPLYGFSGGVVDAIDAIGSQTCYHANGDAGKGIVLAKALGNVESQYSYDVGDMEYTGVNRNASSLVFITHGAMRFLSIAECLLRASVPSQRRHNSYCYPLSKIAATGGNVPNKLTTLYNSISSRYCGINFQAMHNHGTIENRYHSGTTNAMKIIHWARLWARMVDVAVTIGESDIDALDEIVSDAARRAMLMALLALPEDTERYIVGRIKEFRNADTRKVTTYIKNKKAASAVLA